MTAPASPPNLAIPTDPTAVDAAWMDLALRDLAPGARVVGVEFAGYVGTGQMGRNARYRLSWDRPDAGPASVVGKYPTDDPTGRETGFGNGTYLTEWTFYRHVAGTVDVRAPHCHQALFDGDGENFVLLMEDLSGSAQGDQFRGLTVDEAALAVEQAVALHAPRWGDDTVSDLLVRSPAEMVTLIDTIYAATMEGTLARLGPQLEPEVVDLVHRVAPRAGAWAAAADQPKTLVHMDYRPDNFMFGVEPDAPPLVVVDWQTIAYLPGTNDLAYAIGGSFEPDVRAQVERDLVEDYCARLASAGVDYPVEECWRHYRINTTWGVVMSVIATMLAAQTERGDAMLATMLRRHARHAIDLDALAALG
jgi:hypothetical protein